MAAPPASSFNPANKKRALIIGNNSYRQGKTLRYCNNNASAIYVKLCNIHFQATLATDLNCDELDTIIENFVKDIIPGDLIFFYFAGYGAHWNDQNYFVPVDDNLITELPMFRFQAINVQDTFNMIATRSPSASIFMFDVCRSYPMGHIPGLPGSIDFGGFINIQPIADSLIIFPCQENRILSDTSIDGRVTNFTTHVLEYIDQLNLTLDEMVALIVEDVMNATNKDQNPHRICTIKKTIYLNYQNLSGQRHKLNARIEQIINAAQIRSMVDLANQDITDRDIEIIAQEVLVKKQCTRLWMQGNKLTYVGISILAAALANNTTLERLYIYGNRVLDKGAKALSKILAFNNKGLKILNLQETGITDIGVEQLSEMLKTNTTLTVLNLSKNDISDVGVRLLCNVLKKQNNTLQCLDLSKNKKISDLSVEVLIEMTEYNRALNEVSIYDCNLTRTAKEKLRKGNKKKKNMNFFITNWDE